MNVPNTDQGAELNFIIGVEQSVDAYSQRITQVFNAGTNSITSYPTLQGETLSDQLKTIARLIKGGCKTKIYLCQLGGFDLHHNEVVNTATSTGDHANLLNYLSGSVKTFMDDLDGLGLADQVIACTFSEFGRCAAENGSYGTDHGTQAPMFLFGKNVKAGVLGTNVNLSDLTTDHQLKNVQHDYRRIFATLLQDWLGANPDILEQTMFEGYTKISVVDDVAVVDPNCYWGLTATNSPNYNPKPLSVYPNPASVMTEVSYQSDAAFEGWLTLHSLGGTLVSASSIRVQAGDNLYYLDVSALPPGNYFVRLENKSTGLGKVVKLVVSR
jgi:hypothetical protein